jgi:hypothetical protein
MDFENGGEDVGEFNAETVFTAGDFLLFLIVVAGCEKISENEFWHVDFLHRMDFYRNAVAVIFDLDGKDAVHDLGNNIKTASDKFEREAPTLSETQRNLRQKQLMDQDRDFQRKRREFQEDLNTRKNEEQQVVIERANRAVKQVAEAEKYDVIFQEAVYINPKHDITDKVIRSLNSSAGR